MLFSAWRIFHLIFSIKLKDINKAKEISNRWNGESRLGYLGKEFNNKHKVKLVPWEFTKHKFMMALKRHTHLKPNLEEDWKKISRINNVFNIFFSFHPLKSFPSSFILNYNEKFLMGAFHHHRIKIFMIILWFKMSQ